MCDRCTTDRDLWKVTRIPLQVEVAVLASKNLVTVLLWQSRTKWTATSQWQQRDKRLKNLMLTGLQVFVMFETSRLAQEQQEYTKVKTIRKLAILQACWFIG